MDPVLLDQLEDVKSILLVLASVVTAAVFYAIIFRGNVK